MSARCTVLHLRSVAGNGGGPDKTIAKSMEFLDPERFECLVVNLEACGGMDSTAGERERSADPRVTSLAGRAPFDLRQIRAVASLVRARKVRILHCHEPKSDVYGALLGCRFPALRTVSTMHGWIRRRGRSAWYHRLDLWSLRRYAAVVAVSEAVAGIARSRGLKRVQVIHNGIDCEEWRRDRVEQPPPAGRADRKPFTVGYVGRLSSEKGAHDFVRVARRLLDEDPGFEFVVAGEGPERESMEGLAIALGLGRRCRFLGRVGASRIRALYLELDALLSPSLTEGLPNNVLEAAAMKVPVVATAVGGVPEILCDGNNGLLAPAGDVEQLAKQVLSLRKDPALARRLAEEGRVVVEREFSFRQRMKRIESLYLQLLGGKTAGS